jgi:hypothetical protein
MSEVHFTSDQAEALASYVFQLVRLGAAYNVRRTDSGWAVAVTGY